MVTVVELVGLLVILAINATAAALLTRIFRVRLNTQWGSVLYSILLIPIVLVVVVLLLGQALGPNLGSPATLVGVTVVLPMALGMAFDYFWQPAPDEVDLPEKYSS